MRPLLFKNLFVAFLTGLLVIAGVVYAMYITGSSEGGQLFKFSTPNTLPVYSGNSGGHLPVSTTTASFNESDLDVVVSTTSSKISSKITVKVAKTSTSASTFSNTSDHQSNNGRGIYTSTRSSSGVSNTNAISGSYQESARSGGSSRKMANYSQSNISVSKNGTGSSIHRTSSLPGSEDLAMAEFSTSFSASDLTGGPVQQFILPGTGDNPTEEDAVPVPGGIILLIIFALFKYLTYDDKYKKIFTYFCPKC